jgi:hypothetical protein
MVPGRIRFSEVKTGCPEVEKIGVCKLCVKDKLFQVRDSGCVDKQVRWEDSDILVVEGAIIIVWVAGEVVSLIGGAGLVDEFKVKFSHLWEIACNTVTDFLWVPVILQVQVVCKDTNFMWGSHEKVTPSE